MAEELSLYPPSQELPFPGADNDRLTSEQDSPPPSSGWLDRWSRSAVRAVLDRLTRGALELREGGDVRRFRGESQGESAAIEVLRPRFYRRALLGGSIGAAESYIDGDWRSDDLTSVVRMFIQNQQALRSLERWVGWARPLLGAGHWLRRNTIAGSRRNISAHYDLGNDFFELFLDPTMAYSSGVFDRPDMTMEEASIAKFDRLCRKLRLTSSDHLLEIGTGWGGLAVHAATNFGCRVTTTTISQEQHAAAVARVAQAGLTDRVTVLLQDYRRLTGQYDKLVSVEMIEAVGHEFLDGWFALCSRLLKRGGLMAIQAITIVDHLHDAYRRSVDFIQKYVFPGGCLPSVGSMTGSAARATDLRLEHLENLPQHYARTLQLWNAAFQERREEAETLGYSERFLRLWEFYFAYCEAGFREEQIGLAQLVFAKPDARNWSPAGG